MQEIIELTDPQFTHKVLNNYKQYGFIIINMLGDDSNSHSMEFLKQLREAAQRAEEKTRDGNWPHKRTIGHQWPSEWKCERQRDTVIDIWGIQHLLHPELNENTFAEWYCSKPIINVVSTLLLQKSNNNESDYKESLQKLQMGLINMLINPKYENYQLKWHRDTIDHTKISKEEELQQLQQQKFAVQWNYALYDNDNCFWVIPSSHTRITNDKERSLIAEDATQPLPDQLNVTLNAGCALFYDNNLIHRAVYNHELKRSTLHASMAISKDIEQNTTTAKTNYEDHQVASYMITKQDNNEKAKVKPNSQFESFIPPECLPLYYNFIKLFN